jgi:hypothetical protein
MSTVQIAGTVVAVCSMGLVIRELCKEGLINNNVLSYVLVMVVSSYFSIFG